MTYENGWSGKDWKTALFWLLAATLGAAFWAAIGYGISLIV